MSRKFIHFRQYWRKFGLLNSIKIVRLKRMKRGYINLNLNGYKNSLVLRANTSDFITFEQIFINNEYDININFEPKLIIDGGAYVGYSSVYFGNKFPNAKIIALEPAKSNYEILKNNTIKYDNINIFNKGLWSKKAQLAVKDKGFGQWGYLVEEVNDDDENYIEGISISEILGNFDYERIDILKLDIEGSEVEIFSRNYETWLKDVKIIIIELHDRIRPGCSETLFKAINCYEFSISHSGENIILYNKKK